MQSTTTMQNIPVETQCIASLQCRIVTILKIGLQMFSISPHNGEFMQKTPFFIPRTLFFKKNVHFSLKKYIFIFMTFPTRSLQQGE